MTDSIVKRLALALISLAVTGCGSQGSSPAVPAMLQQTQRSSAETSAPLIFVGNTHQKGGRYVHASLLGFSSDANGNVPPVVKIRGIDTDMGSAAGTSTSVAIDKSGRLYATGPNFCEIAVWPAGSNGDVGYTTGFSVPCDDFGAPLIDFVLDRNGDIWVASFQGYYSRGAVTSILEYPPVPAGAKGDIPHGIIRRISGPKSGLQWVLSIALNGKGQVSVQQPTNILTFAETAHGNVAPLSRLEGFRTQLGSAGIDDWGVSGIKYDSHDRLVVCTHYLKPRLLTFAPGAHGNVAPISTLFVPGCSGITVDPQDNIYVAFKASILVYAAGSTGSAQPIRTIRGNRTTLSSAGSVSF